MKKFLILLFLLVFPSLAFAEYTCLEQGLRCNNCVEIDLDVISGTSEKEFFVGGWFYYNITLTNLGDTPINNTITVIVFNPDRETIGENKTYNIFLEPRASNYYFPKYERGLRPDWKSRYDFDVVGSYKIQITSSSPLEFLDCSQESVKQDSDIYKRYFEATPKWEGEWRDKIEQWISVSNMQQAGMLTLTDAMYKITYVIAVLTILLIILTWADLLTSKRLGRDSKTVLTFAVMIVLYLLHTNVLSQIPII